ncbi:ABC transporter permease subunit [Williamsoniiplasma lucivorax]|uniref:Uncharacterized protein n=1 Tax=Williamsoniiplasma lucivorax TaxID=209274 RepID=A0A2S5REF7_9MOLU|nr:ABC transporter permease subunit [Williamsoniiplasma lucivorax]PPE05515.1 hypothetical protein ELUCI_v1c06080 [Williamsoniiplasma lucivorax]
MKLSTTKINWTIVKRSIKSNLSFLIVITICIAILFILGLTAEIVKQDKATAEKPYGNTIAGFNQTVYQPLGIIIFGLLAILLPTKLVSNEIENTSLAILMVSKNSRYTILLSKYMAVFFTIFGLFIFQMIFGMTLLTKFFKVEDYGKFINLNWTYFLGTWTLASISFIFNVFCKKRMNALLISGGILVGSLAMFTISFIFNEYEVISKFRYVSVFGFSDLETILKGDWTMVFAYLVGLPINIGLLFGSLFIFKNKNLLL